MTLLEPPVAPEVTYVLTDLLRDRAAAEPEGTAFVVGRGPAVVATLGFSEWYERTEAAARALAARGVRRGDRVGLFFERLEFVDYARALLRDALRQRPLPDELPVAALLSRLPAVRTHDRPGPGRPDAQDAVPSAPPRPPDLWVELGHSVHPRLVTGSDWPGLAGAMDRAHRDGYDLERHLPRLAAQDPLPDEQPARTLQRRLAEDCPASRLTIPPEVQRRLDRGLADRAAKVMSQGVV